MSTACRGTHLAGNEEASHAGAIVLFEPNSLKDWTLFREALAFIDILKTSEDTRSEMDTQTFETPSYFITTHGSSRFDLGD